MQQQRPGAEAHAPGAGPHAARADEAHGYGSRAGAPTASSAAAVVGDASSGPKPARSFSVNVTLLWASWAIPSIPARLACDELARAGIEGVRFARVDVSVSLEEAVERHTTDLGCASALPAYVRSTPGLRLPLWFIEAHPSGGGATSPTDGKNGASGYDASAPERAHDASAAALVPVVLQGAKPKYEVRSAVEEFLKALAQVPSPDIERG